MSEKKRGRCFADCGAGRMLWSPGGGGGTLGISGWGCAPGILEPIPYSRAAHTYIAHIWQYPPPPGVEPAP